MFKYPLNYFLLTAGGLGKSTSPKKSIAVDVNTYGLELLWRMMQDGDYNNITTEVLQVIIYYYCTNILFSN